MGGRRRKWPGELQNCRFHWAASHISGRDGGHQMLVNCRLSAGEMEQGSPQSWTTHARGLLRYGEHLMSRLISTHNVYF